ncbi:hypothetical protein OR16_25448 [Cupriavidus basilensis OR16]|uniref:Uncharacterized protein n=1 Tax=Cupriavidus basilensis OR16 TaxID=1127483 RepID=H1SAF9_9BURK|nr:hypothetical protein OR16_25448 [Cupriavidus basilensis OR16]
MTKVSGKIDHNDMTIASRQLYGEVKTIVRRPVVHVNDFIIVADKLFGGSAGTSVELRDVGRRLIESGNDRKLHARTYLM